MSVSDAISTARLTTKGQVTVPAEVRRLLSLNEGDSLLFRVTSDGEPVASVTKVPRLRDLAGSFSLPDEWKDASWQEIREHAHRSLATRRMEQLSSPTQHLHPIPDRHTAGSGRQCAAAL